MKTYKNLWKKLIYFDNLESAYLKARRGKSKNKSIQEFEENWRLNLCILLRELRNKTYKPKSLKKFILKDPKTRLICVSDFRDRVVHHALINILQPIFESRFIFDSYASRKGKGTLAAIKRFDRFKQKVTKSNKRNCFIFKADIKHYFQTVDHKILISLIKKKITDKSIIWLTQTILNNYQSNKPGSGMPLGNWTSQFFANIYLNELDQFIKHNLNAKYYLRYVDDFIILNKSLSNLIKFKKQIINFLKKLKLDLHPDKCKFLNLNKGIDFLGFRVFYFHKLIRKRNLRSFKIQLFDAVNNNNPNTQELINSWQGWSAYAMHANTFKIRGTFFHILSNF